MQLKIVIRNNTSGSYHPHWPRPPPEKARSYIPGAAHMVPLRDIAPRSSCYPRRQRVAYHYLRFFDVLVVFFVLVVVFAVLFAGTELVTA